MISDFHLLAVQLGSEEQMLARALASLEPVASGETAFLPEYVAWTPSGSGRAFARLVAFAQERDINIVTTLNVAPDLHEDLPGRDPEQRYNALVIFTRHGDVHVPQAKVTPQTFEMEGDIGIAPYQRINRVRLDWQEDLIEARFVICSDLVALLSLSPAELQCDLLVVLGNFAFGAEKVASRLLGRALQAGVARSAFLVNAFQLPREDGQRPLAYKMEEVLDATEIVTPGDTWPNRRALRSGFHVYEDGAAHDFVSVCRLPQRRGRIAIPRSRWQVEISLGDYPITVAL